MPVHKIPGIVYFFKEMSMGIKQGYIRKRKVK
jgi:hypothetical protein